MKYAYHGWSVYVFPASGGWRAEATKAGSKKKTVTRSERSKYGAAGAIERKIDRSVRENPVMKKSTKKTILIVGGLAAAAGIGYYLYTKSKAPAQLPAANTTPATTTTTTTTSTPTA